MASEIVDAFSRLRRDHPNRHLIFLPATQAALSTADVAESADVVAAALEAAAIEPQRLVLSAVGNVPLAIAVLLACRARGHALLPVDKGTTDAEVAALAEQFDAATVITADRSLAVPTHQSRNTSYRDVAVLKLTSGSSARPRATATPESALISDGRTLAMAMDIRPDDVQIAAIPLSHSYGIGNLVMPLLLQGTAICLRNAFVPQRIPDDARQFNVRHFPGAPFMFDHMAIHPPPTGWPASLTRLVSAGAPLEVGVAERFRAAFGVKIHPFYGTSETGGIAYDDRDGPATEGFVGCALPGVQITLRNEGDDGWGRLHVRSASVSNGYAGGEDADAFVDGGFLTTDLGVLGADGGLTLRGRVSSFVNVAGRKVQPAEVEHALREFPGVVDARVIGMADRHRGEKLVACLVLSGDTPSLFELRSFCGRRLAAHKIPRAFVVLDRIPLTARGKTDRERLRAAAAEALTADGML
jgi:long-chain acyl-CoA synthetase